MDQLQKETDLILPYLSEWKDMHLKGQLSDSDFVGGYILFYLGIRRCRKWCSGRLSSSIVPLEEEESLQSIILNNLPGLTEAMDEPYLRRKLSLPVENLTVLSIFNRLGFVGIKANKANYVNNSMVQWAKGCRPYILLHYIPSPMEVLRMQASGRRVVTMFLRRSELCTTHMARLHYMEGAQLHSRDALEFLLHDIKHMEHFIDNDIHLEQVGFFRCMLGLHEGHPRRFFASPLPCLCLCTTDPSPGPDHVVSVCVCRHDSRGCDIQLWRELEYVISDTNCYSTHLVRYLVAKMLMAGCRQSKDQECLHVDVDVHIDVDVTESVDNADTYRQDLAPRQRAALELRWRLLERDFGVGVDITPAPNEGQHGSGDDPMAVAMAFDKLLQTALGEGDAMDEQQAEALRTFFRNKGRWQ
eukprot:gene5246-10496_t